MANFYLEGVWSVERMTHLSNEDGKAFRKMLKSDAEPNEILRQSAERYCKMNDEKSDSFINRTEFFECVCTTEAHTIRFKLDTYGPDDVELYLSVFLNQYRNFFGRMWIAIRYLFGYKCKYGHWDCTLIKLKDADRLIELLQQYKELSSKKQSQKVSWT